MNIPDAKMILGVGPNCTEEDIKKAFKLKAYEHHPDKGGDTEQFIKIKEAKDLLIQTSGIGVDGIFETLFGKKRPFSHYKKPRSRIPDASLSLKMSYRGGTFIKKAIVQELCKDCSGLGRRGQACVHCKGIGYSDHGNGPMGVRIICGYCAGTGYEQICSTCRGSGMTNGYKDLKFDIRPGTVTDTIVPVKDDNEFDKIRIHIDVPKEYKIFPGKILYRPKVPFEQVITGYKIDILGVDIDIRPFTFNGVDISEDIVFKPFIYADDEMKDKLSKVLDES